MIQYFNGDLFTHSFQPNTIIPHVCNDQGLFMSGFAKCVGELYPEVKRAYIRMDKTLGYVSFVEIQPQVFVANMVAQHETIRTNSTPIRYYALATCMDIIREKKPEHIVAPMFGSGLARGNWECIESLIDEIWSQIDVTIYRMGK